MYLKRACEHFATEGEEKEVMRGQYIGGGSCDDCCQSASSTNLGLSWLVDRAFAGNIRRGGAAARAVTTPSSIGGPFLPQFQLLLAGGSSQPPNPRVSSKASST